MFIIKGKSHCCKPVTTHLLMFGLHRY